MTILSLDLVCDLDLQPTNLRIFHKESKFKKRIGGEGRAGGGCGGRGMNRPKPICPFEGITMN